jgi:hypothetical protein
MKAVCKKNFNRGLDTTNGIYVPITLFKRGEVYSYINRISSSYISGYYGVIGADNFEYVFNTPGFREYFTTVKELRRQKLEKINNV